VEKEHFVDVEAGNFWLLERELDGQLLDARDELGKALGWSGTEWWTERQKLEEMYQHLERERPELLRELDDVNDLDKQKRWVRDVTDTVPSADASAAASTVTDAAASVAPAAPAESEAAAPPAPPPAAKKASPFAKKAAEPAQPTTQADDGVDVAPAASGAAAPTAPPPAANKASPFAKKAAEPAQPTDGEDVAPVKGAATESAETIREMLSGFGEDPDVPIEPHEIETMLNEPDFHQKLADEEAKLEQELADALGG
jgi:hypothetical protein